MNCCVNICSLKFLKISATPKRHFKKLRGGGGGGGGGNKFNILR